MKTDTPTMAKDHLVQVINAEYGLNIASITFVPKGEEAYIYIAQVPDGVRYFIRAQPSTRAGMLEHVYTITHALHTQYNLSQIVAPYVTYERAFTIRFGKYTVAVFPFIEGNTLYWQEPSDTDLMEAATLLATVHQCDTALATFSLYQETFANPFKTSILQALHGVEAPLLHATSYQRQVCRLLEIERADILATLERMDQLQVQAQKLATEWVLTHGDPNLDNWLKDQQGKLHLTDWGSIAIGPPERDLFAFTGNRFEVFLRHYARVRHKLTLHRDIFAFYFYCWTMQEIADYATRILFQDLGSGENEHAWTELQAYLPIRHNDIIQGLQDLQSVIESVVGISE